MKFFIAVLCSSHLITAEASPCSFCEGVDVDQAIELPYTDGMTCGTVTLASSVLEEGTEDCSLIQGSEVFCCPEVLLSEPTGGPCSFCVGKDVLGFMNPQIPMEDAELAGMNCENMAAYAEFITAPSAMECYELSLMEGTCCPAAMSSSGTSPRYVQCVHVSYRACLHPAACLLHISNYEFFSPFASVAASLVTTALIAVASH
jgi:hypothetical protein